MATYAHRVDIDAAHISGAVRDLEHPLLQPRLIAVGRPRPLGVIAIESVVSLEESLHRRWMGAAGFMHDRDHLRLGKENSIGVTQSGRSGDELFARDDHPVDGEAGLLS